MHEEFDLYGWRYCGLEEATYERRTLLFGGPILMSLSGVASFMGNRRRRREAERLAAPQWRPLGPIHVVVADDRLLVWFNEAWSTVWLASVIDVHRDPGGEAIDMFFADDPPFRFSGTESAALADVVAKRADETAPEGFSWR